MKQPVFSRDALTLCDIPVPKGYPQSQTHCGIILYEGKWFMTTSPFPTIQHSKFVNYLRLALHKFSGGLLVNPKRADRFENPCLYVGDARQGFPTSFHLIGEKALMDTPEQPKGGYAYNSDPDLFIEDGKTFILNRTAYCRRGADNEAVHSMTLHLIEGRLFEGSLSDMSITELGDWDSSTIVSHSLTKYDGTYQLMYLDTISALDGKTFTGLYCKTADSVNGLKQAEERQIKVLSGNLLPWHLSLFQHEGTLYTIIACVEKGTPKGKVWQFLGEFSKDLSSLKVYDTPLTDYCSYRGSAAVTSQGLFVLYTPTWNEKVRGSKSVDGKDVLMGKAPFEEVLRIVKK